MTACDFEPYCLEYLESVLTGLPSDVCGLIADYVTVDVDSAFIYQDEAYKAAQGARLRYLSMLFRTAAAAHICDLRLGWHGAAGRRDRLVLSHLSMLTIRRKASWRRAESVFETARDVETDYMLAHSTVNPGRV